MQTSCCGCDHDFNLVRPQQSFESYTPLCRGRVALHSVSCWGLYAAMLLRACLSMLQGGGVTSPHHYELLNGVHIHNWVQLQGQRQRPAYRHLRIRVYTTPSEAFPD